VVVILGILATIAGVGYSRWIGRARRAEAVALLAEIASREQIYFSEFGSYHPLRADAVQTLPSPDESTAAFYPLSPSDADFDSRRVATAVGDATSWPVGWRNVGIRPRRPELFCTYMANAGLAGEALPTGVGATMFANTPPPEHWFYALAACNLSGASGFPSEVTVLGLTSDSGVLREINEGR